jgi:hypothetical protein
MRREQLRINMTIREVVKVRRARVGVGMFEDYSDITERIAETPKWWDENGVPRYVEFEPRRAANIYAVEVVLLDIACFMCLRRFQVALSGQGGAHRDENGVSLADQIRSGDIDYCDPPNYGNCRDGARQRAASTSRCLNTGAATPCVIGSGMPALRSSCPR